MKRLIKNNAKQVGTLYHYTFFYNLIQILEENTLGFKSDSVLFQRPVSFTRNQNFHNVERSEGIGSHCRILIDGNKISENYKIRPYSDKEYIMDEDFGTEKMEQEEIVMSDISPIIPYIISIDLFQNQEEDILDDVRILKSIYTQWNNKEMNNLNDIINIIKYEYDIEINIM